MIIQSEIKVKKNYVEKYYTVNSDMFSRVTGSQLESSISGLSTPDLRDLMISFLITNSMIFSILAKELEAADDDEMESFRKQFMSNRILMSFSSIPGLSIERLTGIFRSFTAEEEKNLTEQVEEYMLFVLAFQSIKQKKS